MRSKPTPKDSTTATVRTPYKPTKQSKQSKIKPWPDRPSKKLPIHSQPLSFTYTTIPTIIESTSRNQIPDVNITSVLTPQAFLISIICRERGGESVMFVRVEVKRAGPYRPRKAFERVEEVRVRCVWQVEQHRIGSRAPPPPPPPRRPPRPALGPSLEFVREGGEGRGRRTEHVVDTVACVSFESSEEVVVVDESDPRRRDWGMNRAEARKEVKLDPIGILNSFDGYD
ncbi:hypothetical protein G7K_6585-t1 [Saitoella complicata NRRL Y-17804]|uniref:Uncharacterized protein n=1 Tax=Saitoella complicata (strain BCRC 22490 / CBS 7301 / JCM 7358 / NBRC 10748 / NRRL Y-17804) TaxID=698492 RepID=A0A0E9NS82_SAICN|nr:hypothetical protein G7K_6585-t1 [Saitoella complicata NRRL Y-17804]